jgi:hypothetical protein
MERVSELFVERGNRMLAVGLLGRIILEAFKLASETPDSELGKLFGQMSPLIPEHYLASRAIQVENYKTVSFVDSQSLIFIISEAEAFFQDVLFEVICRHPEKIDKSGATEADIRLAGQKYITKLLYKRPNEYKKKLLSLLSAEEDLLDDLWPLYVEAKARRDIGVHNSWVVNETYTGKVNEVGLADSTETELSVDVDYFLRTRDAIITLMKRINQHCKSTFA